MDGHRVRIAGNFFTTLCGAKQKGDVRWKSESVLGSACWRPSSM